MHGKNISIQHLVQRESVLANMQFGEGRWEIGAEAITLEQMYGNWQLSWTLPSSNNCRLVI